MRISQSGPAKFRSTLGLVRTIVQGWRDFRRLQRAIAHKQKIFRQFDGVRHKISKLDLKVVMKKFQIALKTRPKESRSNGRKEIVDGDLLNVLDDPPQATSTQGEWRDTKYSWYETSRLSQLRRSSVRWIRCGPVCQKSPYPWTHQSCCAAGSKARRLSKRRFYRSHPKTRGLLETQYISSQRSTWGALEWQSHLRWYLLRPTDRHVSRPHGRADHTTWERHEWKWHWWTSDEDDQNWLLRPLEKVQSGSRWRRMKTDGWRRSQLVGADHWIGETE